MDIRAIEQVYRRYARLYDFVFGAVYQPGRKAIVERMDRRADLTSMLGDHGRPI